MPEDAIAMQDRSSLSAQQLSERDARIVELCLQENLGDIANRLQSE
ncbi:MAG: hypothetical protein R3C49_07540 [Planctomycetaceae bacterium]